MSYVLDALKKSEQERRALQRPSNHPALKPGRVVKSHRFGVSLILIITALIVGWWGAQWQDPDSYLSEDIHPPSISASAVVEVKNQLEFPAEMQSAQELSVSTTASRQVSVNSPVSVTEKPPVILVEEEAPVFTLVTPASPVSNAYPQTSDAEAITVPANIVIPSLHELKISEQQSIPTVKIEGHIYDVEPAARMVIINGKVRKEKHTIVSGLLLQEITPDGVIMNYQGRVFQMGVFDQ